MKLDDEKNMLSFHKRFPYTRILVLNAYLFSSLSFLEPLSGLKALFILFPLPSSSSLLTTELAINVPQLTHLELYKISEQSDILLEPFTLTQLQYLSLTFLSKRFRDPHRSLIENWSFPVLKTLFILGYLCEGHGEPIQNFMVRHANTLTGLTMGYYCLSRATGFEGRTRLSNGFLNRFQNLDIFGIDIQWLFPGSVGWIQSNVPKCRSAFTALIQDFGRFSWNNPENIIINLLDLQSMWNVDTFICLEPWEETKSEINLRYRGGRDYHRIKRCFDKLLEMLEKEKVAMTDLFNVSLKEAFEDLLQ